MIVFPTSGLSSRRGPSLSEKNDYQPWIDSHF